MTQLGSGNGTGWPTVLDTRQTYANGSNAAPDSNRRIDAEVINDLLALAVQIETILGTNPQGAFASVRARLDALLGTGSALYNPNGVVYGGPTGQLIDAYPHVQLLTAFRRFQAFGRVFDTFTSTITTTNGAAFVSSAAFIPAGVQIDGVLILNTQTWSNANGLTTLQVGDLADPDRWGTGISRTLNNGNNIASFTNTTIYRTTTTSGITLTPNAGTFGATGAANVTAFVQYFLPQ